MLGWLIVNSFVESKKFHELYEFLKNAAQRYEIDLDKTVLAQHMNRMSFNRAAYDLILHQAYDALNEAKTLHDKLERCYIDAMNFDRLSEMRTRTIAAL